MAASYITKAERGGWKYQRHVPEALRPLLGGRKVWRDYRADCGRRDAEAWGRALALDHDRLIMRLKQLTPAERDILAHDGALAAILPTLTLASTLQLATPAEIDRFHQIPEGMSHGEMAMSQLEGQRRIEALRVRATSAADVLVKLAPADTTFNFDGLLKVYRDRVKPTRWDNHERTVRELTEALGNLDYRNVTPDDIAKFRDALGKKGKGYTWENDHLVRTSAMFAAAINARAYKHRNPCDGIKPLSREDAENKAEKGSFSGAQVRTILETATKVRFGDTKNEKRHDAALWVLRALSFSGARPEEVLLLQRGDVTTVDGVPVIEIRRTCCVTGERLTLKSIKNKSSRRTIPMHPALWDTAYQRKNGLPVASFLDFAKGDAAQFLFECFPWNATKYRRGWFDAEFGPFMKDACGIVPGVGEKLSLTSLRNRFHDAMEHAGIGGVHERLIAGRAAPDVHEAYKRGKNLKALAESVAKIDVLSDD